ncbi:MAG: helix-turn-helix domain-containing protein [Candidatus Altiarchaeota archaeon]
MDTSILEKIGLSKAEIQVYITLLEIGSTPSARIISETGFRKSTVYDSIRRLQEKGLVSSITRDSKKRFEATDPDRLIEFLHDKKRLLDDYEEEVNDLVPKLKKGFTTLKPQAEAHVLVGVEGFKTMRRDSIRNAEKDILILGGIAREMDVMPKFYENWTKSRQLKKIEQRVLIKESVRKKVLKNLEQYKFKARFLPEEFESPAVVNIYGDRVVDTLWKGNHPICFVLINADIADSYRKYFNYLWKRAKK